ncbi:hypothetical protein CDIK_4085 [Cucumispora dikerogammari]|nr:hypothetical protein CDIK_4085 [Cucumispora dikerogammari]
MLVKKLYLTALIAYTKTKIKDLIAKTDLEKIVQDFVKKTNIYDQLSPEEYINIRYNELDEVVNEFEEEKFDENKNEIDEIEPVEEDKCVIESEILSAMDLLYNYYKQKEMNSSQCAFFKSIVREKKQYLTKKNEGHFSVSVLFKNNIYSRFL